jgi:hypothetical protein
MEPFALFDTGAGVCIIYDDVLGVQLDEPRGVFFAFKYISLPLTQSEHINYQVCWRRRY